MSELIKMYEESGMHQVPLPITSISERGIDVYRVETEFKGNLFTYIPQIPKNRLAGENDIFPRICCALTVYGALISSTALYDLYSKYHVDEVPEFIGSIYIYKARAKVSNIVQCEYLVPDAGITGELWLTEPTKFQFVGEYHLYEKYRLPRCAFTMYALRPLGKPLEGNMRFTFGLQALEGGLHGGMHFIARDPSREREATYWISHFNDPENIETWAPTKDEHDWREDPWNK